MSSTADDTGVQLDPVEIRDDLIRVTREIELRGAGLVITHRISPTDDTAVEFRVVDTLASNFDIDDLGFHPAFEPSDGRITPEETVIEGTVEPGYAREIVTGICPAQPKRPKDVRRLHEAVQPTIASSEPWNPETGVQNVHDASIAEGNRSASLFTRLKRRLWGVTSGKQSEAVSAERHADSEREREPRREDALEHLDDVFTDVEAAEAETPDPEDESTDTSAVDWAEFWGYSTSRPSGSHQRFRSRDSEPETEASDEASRRADIDVWPDLEFHSETIARANKEYHTFTEIFEDIEIEPTDGDSNGTASADVATRLIGQLDADDWPLGKRRRLAQELLDETTLSTLPTADLEDRVETLETRIDEISDYTEALAATIDTHGSAQEYLNDVTGELDELETARRRVRTRLEWASSERNWIQEQIEAVTERATRIESKLDRLENQETALRSRHERSFSTFETEVSDLESVAEAVEVMESEVQSVREVLAD